MKRPTNNRRRRLRMAVIGISASVLSLGVVGATAQAQEAALQSRIQSQLNTNQAINNNPVRSAVGQAARGVLQGQNFGDAVQSGLRAGANQAVQNYTYGQPYNNGYYNNNGYNNNGYYSNGRFYGNGYYNNGNGYYRSQPGYAYQNGSQYQYANPYQGNVQSNVVTRFDMDGNPYRVRLTNRSGARLGISMKDSNDGLQVRNVARSSAAAEAGLQPGDMIVSVNGKDVADAQQMIDLVGQRKPGDKLDLTVMRDGQEQSLSAKLQGFPERDRQSMARPRMQGNGNMNGANSVDQLRNEIDDLRRQVDALNSRVGINAQGRTGADLDTNARGNADVNADATSDAGVNADAGTDLDSSIDSDINSDINADTEAGFDATETIDDATEGNAGVEGNVDANSTFDNEGVRDIGTAGEAGADLDVDTNLDTGSVLDN